MKLYYDSKDLTVTLDYPLIAVLHHYDSGPYIQVVCEEYTSPLGRLLIQYLEIDTQEITKILDKYFSIAIPRNRQEHEKNLDSIMNGLNKLIKLHPYFMTLASLRLEDNLKNSISQYITYANRILDNEDSDSEANLKALTGAIKKINNPFSIDDLHVNDWYMSHLKSSIEFSFFDDSYPEFSDLEPFDKFEIYDSVHTGVLGSKRFEQSISSLSSSIIKEKDMTIVDLDNKQDRELIAQKFRESSNRFITEYDTDPFTALLFELSIILKSGISIKKCDNCDKYFIPDNRKDEKYCNRINSNGKSCKDIGWYTKEKSDEFKEYRRVSENFRKLVRRNQVAFDSLGYPITAESLFEEWKKIALNRRELVSTCAFSPKEYKFQQSKYIMWLENSYKRAKKVLQNKMGLEDDDSFLEDESKKKLIHWLENSDERS